MEKKLINAAYCRVSTDIQKEKGESIDNQKSRLSEYAKGKHQNIKIYEDVGSAKDTNRPALTRLIREIKEGKVKSVSVTKLDRITRSIRDLIDLLELFEDNGVDFKSITQPLDTSTAMGRGFLRLLGEFAQMEREMISERVGEDMRHRAKNGKWNGGVVPYGYRVENKKLYINHEESEVIKKIFNKYIKLESLRGVTHWLNKNGCKTRNGKTWAATSISRILSNPTYIGKLWYNKRSSSKTTGKLKNRPKEEWIKSNGQHKPIISGKMFNRVQEIIKRQTREPRRKMSNYLLSGLVRCGKCGGGMSGYTQKKVTYKGDMVYPYYKCNTHKSKGDSVCEGNSINKKMLESIVIEKVLELTESNKFKVDVKRALSAFNKKVKREENPLRSEKNRLDRRSNEISRKKRNLLECLEDGTIDKELYKGRIVELNLELDKNRSKLYEIESKINDIGIEDISFNSVYESIGNFKNNWKHLDYTGKKDLLWSIISKVVVKGEKIKIDLFFLPSLFSKVSSRMDMGS